VGLKPRPVHLSLLFFSFLKRQMTCRSPLFFLIYIYIYKKIIGKRHVALCGRRQIICLPKIQPPLGGWKIRPTRFFFTKKHVFQPISTTQLPTNTLKTSINQTINLINPKMIQTKVVCKKKLIYNIDDNKNVDKFGFVASII